MCQHQNQPLQMAIELNFHADFMANSSSSAAVLYIQQYLGEALRAYAGDIFWFERGLPLFRTKHTNLTNSGDLLGPPGTTQDHLGPPGTSWEDLLGHSRTFRDLMGPSGTLHARTLQNPPGPWPRGPFGTLQDSFGPHIIPSKTLQDRTVGLVQFRLLIHFGLKGTSSIQIIKHTN